MKRSFKLISLIKIVLFDTEEILNSDSDEENKLLFLMKMGYSEVKASITMERYGLDSSITELTDFICAAQMAKATDALLMRQRKLEKKLLNEDNHAIHLSILMIGSGVPTKPDQITQRTLPEDAIRSPYFCYEQIHFLNPMIGFGVHTKPDQITQRTLPEDAIGSPYFYYEQINLSNPMIGFGVHTKPDQITQRTLPEDAIGSPYFYYENVALAPKGSARLLKLMTMNHLRVSRSIFLMSTENGIWYGLEGIKLFHLNLMSDAEAVFYCLGISLKIDVQELNDDQLEQLMSRFGKFDLVVDGTQPNNLTGRNKHHQDELEDFCWCIFLQ
ncbi:hypothetical protein F3Y22_tig00112980pilonHSYRG00027 [Hibiscus syriacus]|uniref:DNA (Cytosine-5)-methyltransferase DRM1/2 n=1 Tax=Hibiscus syriacus TaxID=106335 RepID=A0A6A2WR54_HIBSY|nr:hypothetical protein F3Y22_tig00112980pilonHSYRG00027 [Hibiscus syriacus]